MTEPDDQGPVRPWQWPAKWIRDEGFWQQVASSTMASLLAAMFVYLGAITLGYIQGPSGRGVLALIFAGVLMPALFLWVLIAVMNRRYKKQIAKGDYSLTGYPLWASALISIMSVGLLLVTTSVLANLIRG